MCFKNLRKLAKMAFFAFKCVNSIAWNFPKPGIKDRFMIMKAILTLSLLFLVTTSSLAEDKLACSLYHAFLFKNEVQKLENDKQMHCSMSCLIARKCKTSEVVLIGFIKEFVDALGYGTPDPNDIAANLKGISVAKKGTSESGCYTTCRKIYPKQ